MTSGNPGPGRQAADERGVGALLAEARESQGLTLDDIANQLKFSTRQIEALEAGRFEQLPGGPFVRGMVRSYARLVNLDPAALLTRMGVGSAAQDTNRIAIRFNQPVPFSDSSKRSNVIYAALSLVVLAVAAIVVIQWRQDRSVPAVKPAPPPVVVAAPAEAPSPILESEIPPPPPVRAAAPKPQAAPAERSVPPVATAGRQRVGLRLDAESWIEIKDATGATLVSQLIPGGTERTIEGEAPLSVVIGNAHHVQLTHNGKPVDLKPHIKVEVARLTLK